MGFPGSSAVKNLPAVQETWVRSLSREDPLEEGMATHSSMLAWRIPWTEEPGRLQSMGLQRVGHDWSDLACRHALQLTAGIYRLIQGQRTKELVWDSSSASAWLYRGKFPLHGRGHDQNRKRTPALVIFLMCLVLIFSSVGSSLLPLGSPYLQRAWASHCSGFCCCRGQALGGAAFSSCGTCTWLPFDPWNLPRPGIDPVSPALAGRFLAIGPPGKPSPCHLRKNRGNVGICPWNNAQGKESWEWGRVVPEREYPLGPACLVGAESSSCGLWSVTLPRSELQPWQCLRCQSEQRGSEWQVCFKDVATTPRAEKQEELVVKKTDPKPYYLASNPGSAVYLLCQFRQMA